MTIYCSRCARRVAPKLSWHPTLDRKGFHLRIECSTCTSFVKWAKQTPDWLALAPPKPRPTVADDKQHRMFGEPREDSA